MAESFKQLWPRTISDFLVLQFRIGLLLIIFIPLAIKIRKDWDRLPPSTIFILCVCLAPIIALIFLVNRKTLLWTSFLILFTAVGGAIGLILGFFTSDPSENERILLIASIPAGLFWWLAIRIKYRYTKGSEPVENGG